MARVSLILPVPPGCSPSEAKVEELRLGLEAQGHSAEVVEVVGGLAMAAVEGIDEAEGDLLVVLDPALNHTAEDLGRLLEPLIAGRADLAVASRARGPGVRGLLASGPALLARLLVGTTAPLSGLIALTRGTARNARGRYAPIGSLFALELLVKSAGPRVEVPIRMDDRGTRARMTLDEVRHLKRLADARFGNASRLVQFCLVGASGMVVDLTCYALFQLVFSRTTLAGLRTPMVGGSLDLAVAGALAIVLALTWNFSLNRRLTFSDARQGSIVRQYLTYALSNALGIALSFSLRLMLPSRIGFFARHRLAAAVVGIVGATGISFSMSRWLVFSRRSTSHAAARREPETAECDPRTMRSSRVRTTRRTAEWVTASK